MYFDKYILPIKVELTQVEVNLKICQILHKYLYREKLKCLKFKPIP